MINAKEMIYKNTHSVELLMEGSYCGYKFAIVSLGTHPAAYVENKYIFSSLEDTRKETFNFKGTERLVTFLDKPFWNNKDETVYFGWNYCGKCDCFGISKDDKTAEKQWTTEEIYNDIVEVIEYFANRVDYVDNQKTEKQSASADLKTLLFSLYYFTMKKPLTLTRKDVLALAKDYGVAEIDFFPTS